MLDVRSLFTLTSFCLCNNFLLFYLSSFKDFKCCENTYFTEAQKRIKIRAVLESVISILRLFGWFQSTLGIDGKNCMRKNVRAHILCMEDAFSYKHLPSASVCACSMMIFPFSQVVAFKLLCPNIRDLYFSCESNQE